MSDKLGEAKQILTDIDKLKNNHDHDQADNAKCYLVENFGNYLIEQAEKVEELETSEVEWVEYQLDVNEIIKQLEEQGKRYREVMELAMRQASHEYSDGKAVRTLIKGLEDK